MNIPREQIDRARNADLVALVGRHVKLTRKGRVYWGLCPFHPDTDASFKVDPHWPNYVCFGCGARGDAIRWLRETEGLPFADAVGELAGVNRVGSGPSYRPPIARPARDPAADTDTMVRVRVALAIFSTGSPITGTVAETYLRSRGILVEPDNPSLKFAAAYRADGGVHPAMVAALRSPSDKISAVQVTALRRDGSGKADIETPRRTFGVTGASAVRLADATDVLGLAEGVETGLSAMQLTGIPTWACIGAGRMDRVAVPDSVRTLHIFADDDAAGEKAAQQTAAAHRNRRVIIRLPPDGGDWNDVVMRRAEGEIVEVPAVPA